MFGGLDPTQHIKQNGEDKPLKSLSLGLGSRGFTVIPVCVGRRDACDVVIGKDVVWSCEIKRLLRVTPDSQLVKDAVSKCLEYKNKKKP
ncbi:hypothetical protein ACF0H5_001463 [Mactra antiquata]